MSNFAKSLVVAFSLSFGLSNAGLAHEKTKDCKNTMIEPWVKVNGVFHKIYGKRRSEIKKTLDPIVIVKGNQLILVRDGKRQSFVLTSDRYDFFKIVSHIPLAIYVSLYDDTDKSINDDTTAELVELKKSILIARKNLADWKLSDSLIELQNSIIDPSLSFIDEVVSNKEVSKASLRSFTRKMAPLTLDNAYEAVKIELGTIDRNLRPYKKQLSKKEWNNLYVVVLSSHMPRIKERRVQYFSKLFKEANPGHRIIYYEGPPYDEAAALKLVATHILDRNVAVDFFKDPERMHRDLLSDAAKKYLKKNKLKWSRK